MFIRKKTPEKEQIFTRGYDKHVKGKNVLVIEDLTTTGGSVRKVVDSVKVAGGNVVAVCVMVNRDPNNVTSEVVGGPFSALGILPAEAFDEAVCPLCAKMSRSIRPSDMGRSTLRRTRIRIIDS